MAIFHAVSSSSFCYVQGLSHFASLLLFKIKMWIKDSVCKSSSPIILCPINDSKVASLIQRTIGFLRKTEDSLSFCLFHNEGVTTILPHVWFSSCRTFYILKSLLYRFPSHLTAGLEPEMFSLRVAFFSVSPSDKAVTLSPPIFWVNFPIETECLAVFDH